MEGIRGTILLLCLIGLTNANSAPIIQKVSYEFCEDIPIGGTAFQIVATDTENDPLTYSISGPNAAFFSVNRDTGVVTVRQPLDRESNVVMTLQVVVSDGPNSATGQLNLILLDANDNRPLFQESSYGADVPENTAAGTSLFTVQATDADSGAAGAILYRIQDVIPSSGSGFFSISASGEVKLEKRLNYTSLSTFYRLNITATDGEGICHSTESKVFTSFALAFITVVDVADLDPQFINAPYQVRVEENTPEETSVSVVTAIDPDTGINDKIIYSIQASTEDGLFTINPDSGVISVASPIDREDVGNTVTLTVKATESKQNINGVHASATATVKITITDKNDNPPEFYKCGETGKCVVDTHFTGEVEENSLGSVSINMTVKDPDEFPRTRLTLEGADKDVFSVDPRIATSDSIVQLLVKQPQMLDFEKTQQMVLQVVAVDEEDPTFHSTATVTIDIKDANDNIPKFQNNTYKLQVPENSPDGTTVGTITAEDPDTMDQDKLTYKLLPDSILPYFDVVPQTGAIYVKNQTLLDREVRSFYSMTLQAEDTDNKVGSTAVEITVTDVNDNVPEFIPSDAVFVVVSESASKGTSVAGVTATDPDSGENGQIEFKVTEVLFQDNNDQTSNKGMLFEAVTTQQNNIYVGIIQTTQGLDISLKGKYLVTVNATDKGGLYSSTVLDIFTVDESYKVELQFEKSRNYVEQNLDKILRSLTAATKAAVEVVALDGQTAGESRATDITVMEAYFVYSNGTALTSDDVEEMVSDPEHYPILADLGLMFIGKAPVVEAAVDPLKYVLLGMVGGLIIVLAVLTTSLLCTRRTFKRKLKAAKAMNSASMVTSDNQKGGPVVPGTNKYTMEGANPVLNLNIDTTALDEDSDVDKVSINSLDYTDEVTPSGKDIMQGIQEEEEEEYDDMPPEYIEPLGAALAQRGQKKNNPLMGYNNPTFGTTDL